MGHFTTDIYQRLFPAGEEPPERNELRLRFGVWDGETFNVYTSNFLKIVYLIVTYFSLIPFQNLSKYFCHKSYKKIRKAERERDRESVREKDRGREIK